MSNKLIRTILFLSITFICAFGLINPVLAADSAETAPSHRIQVYYLHNTFRCFSCNSIGDLTQAAVLGGVVENPATGEKNTIKPAFQGLIEQGKLSFAAVNVDDSENHHFLADFHTRSKFPVVVEIKDGKIARYKVLDKVWTLLHGPQDKFISYIQKNVSDFTKGL